MSAPRFTKGPWAYKWFGGPQIGGGKGGAKAVCTLWGSWRNGDPSAEECANRDLICAAPDLYAALDAVELARHSDAPGDWERATMLTDLAFRKTRGEPSA